MEIATLLIFLKSFTTITGKNNLQERETTYLHHAKALIGDTITAREVSVDQESTTVDQASLTFQLM